VGYLHMDHCSISRGLSEESALERQTASHLDVMHCIHMFIQGEGRAAQEGGGLIVWELRSSWFGKGSH